MSDEGRRCALPGCDVEIETADGRPERRYCCAAHRHAARRERRAATHARRPPTTGDLAETLPWLRTAAPPADRPEPTVHASDERSTGPVLRPVVHRTVAATEPGAVARAAARRSRDARTTRPRRRALAMLGVAGRLAGGYAVLKSESAPPVLVQTTPDGEAADAWAQRATVALAAVNRQLDTLAQTEEQWQQLPASRSPVVPAPLAALEERRSVLQQRRATLQSQLDTYRSMRETQQDLADSEQHLQAVEKALADAPSEHRRSPTQEAAATALDEQRDLRIRQRDSQRAELANLEDGVAAAARTPLPDDDAATTAVRDDVLKIVRNGGREPDRRDPAPSRPDVVDGREHDDGSPSRDAGTSAPPDPRKSRDDSEERRPAPRPTPPPPSGPARPGSSRPGPAQPGFTRPGPPLSRVPQPDPRQPDPRQPDPRQPAPPQPGSAQAGSSQPGPGPDSGADPLAQLRERARAAARAAARPWTASRPGTAAPTGKPAPRQATGPSGTDVSPGTVGSPEGMVISHPPDAHGDGTGSVPASPVSPGAAESDPVGAQVGPHPPRSTTGPSAGPTPTPYPRRHGPDAQRSQPPARSAQDRSTGRHASGTTGPVTPQRHGAHRAADPESPRSDKPGSDKPGSDKPGSDKPGSDKPGSDKPGSNKADFDRARPEKPRPNRTDSGKSRPDRSDSEKPHPEKSDSKKRHPEKPDSTKSDSEKSHAGTSPAEKSRRGKSGSGTSDRPGRSLDTHDDFIRLSRSLASTSSRA